MFSIFLGSSLKSSKPSHFSLTDVLATHSSWEKVVIILLILCIVFDFYLTRRNVQKRVYDLKIKPREIALKKIFDIISPIAILLIVLILLI